MFDIKEYAESRISRNMDLSDELETAAQTGDLLNVQRQLREATCHIDAAGDDWV